MCEFIVQKNGVTTLVTGARQVGQAKEGAWTDLWAWMQAAQKPWPHGARMRRGKRGHCSRQTAHVNLQSSLALPFSASSAFFTAQALWSCAMASNLRRRVCKCLCRCALDMYVLATCAG